MPAPSVYRVSDSESPQVSQPTPNPTGHSLHSLRVARASPIASPVQRVLKMRTLDTSHGEDFAMDDKPVREVDLAHKFEIVIEVRRGSDPGPISATAHQDTEELGEAISARPILVRSASLDSSSTGSARSSTSTPPQASSPNGKIVHRGLIPVLDLPTLLRACLGEIVITCDMLLRWILTIIADGAERG